MHKFFLCSIILLISNLQAKAPEEEGEKSPLPKWGNFRLPTAQQPVKLFGDEQTIVDKGDLLFFNGLLTNKGSLATKEFAPGILYGMTDGWSILFSLPVALEQKSDDFQTSGIEDATLLTEFTLYKRESHRSAQLWTMQLITSFPTGNPRKVIPTGLGYPTYSIATLFSHTTVKFFCGTGIFASFNTNFNGTQAGNSINFNLAMGYNLGHPMHGILTGMLEFDMSHRKRNTVACVKDPLSGGNIVYLGPTLFWSFANVVMQTGIQFPLMQHFHNPAERYGYRAVFLISWILD